MKLDPIALQEASVSLSLPLASSRVAAGFPSPADDHIEKNLSLDEYLVKNPIATFFVRVMGDSMIQAGIFPGDLLVVDRSLVPVNRSIIIAILDGELTVKRFLQHEEEVALEAANNKYPNIKIDGERDFQVWGVVTHCVHKV